MSDRKSIFTKIQAPHISLTNLVQINSHEFVGASSDTYADDEKTGLYKYNTLSNEWILFIKYPDEFESNNTHHMCYDEKNDIIYLYNGYDGQMVLFKLETKEVEIIKTKVSVGDDPQLIMINHECHVILGSKSRSHYKWNSKLKELQKIVAFNYPGYFKQDEDGVDGHRVINIKSQNRLLLFGQFYVNGWVDGIWEYKYNTNTTSYWEKLDGIEIPIDMGYDFKLILSNDEKYLIIFGANIKNIFILDLYDMKLYSSNITLPFKNCGSINAVSMINETDTILVSGFVKRMEIEYNMNIPTALKQLLNMYLVSETIYLRTEYYGYHMRRLEMKDILESKMTDLYVEYFSASEEEDFYD